MSTVVAFLAVACAFASLSVLGWRIHRRELHHVMQRTQRELDKFAKTIGEAFIPAVQQATAAFAEAFVGTTEDKQEGR